MTDVPTWEKKILPLVLSSMVEAEKFSDHPRTVTNTHSLISDHTANASGRTGKS